MVGELCLAKANPGTATVLVDELDAGGLKSTPYSQVVCCGHSGFFLSKLCAPYRSDA
jgi:hypothetical protein